MDYSEFEGKVIEFIDRFGNKYDGYIAGCDYDIGITIIDNNDRNKYLYCFRGPSYSPNFKYDDHHKESFENSIAMFEKGFFDRRIDLEIDRKYNKNQLPSGRAAGPDSCAFNK